MMREGQDLENDHSYAADKAILNGQQRKTFRVERFVKNRQQALPNGTPPQASEFSVPDILLQRIEDLHARFDAIEGITPGLPGEEEDQHIRVEVARLVKEIGKTKVELASLRHPLADDEKDTILSATNELDAIVAATEKATDTILHASEEISVLLERFRGDSELDDEHRATVDLIEAKTIAILEACNFQDITGQRINKVVNAMKFIEDRVKAMIDIWGVEAFSYLPLPGEEVVDGDAALLEGPQLDNLGLTQDDIDAMFD